MKSITFKILGEPVGQGRPRFARIGKRTVTYDPTESREYKSFIKYIAQETAKNDGWDIDENGAYCIIIKSYFGISKSQTKKFKALAIENAIRPTKKCDVDNISKIVMDALTGILYKDDKQIVDLHCCKYYAEEPCTVVEVAKCEELIDLKS